MDEVTINGVRYVPADQTPPPRIGVGITTRNRRDIFNRSLTKWREHLPDNAILVVVDDASDDPVPGADFRFNENAGIARAKNKAIELLMDAGCDALFLADDDIYPLVDEWHQPYLESSEPHAMYIWGEHPVYTGHVTGYLRPKGALLYANRSVIDTVGGMDPQFGLWGGEHESWSDRIHNASLTTCRYQDVTHKPGIFYAADEHENIPSSVPERVRLAWNPELAEANRDSTAYIPYRDTPTQAPATVALSILVASVHTRRHTTAPDLVDDLFTQWENLPPTDQTRVEVMVLTDTKTMPLGVKRNTMVTDASGDYVAFVDDDDRIEPDYLTSLLEAIDQHRPDVVTFHTKVTVNGSKPKLCKYSTDYADDHDTPSEYRRLPNHICCVRRDLVLRNPFPPVRYGEDREYAKRLKPLLLTEHAIDRVLYHYDYDHTKTETQLAQRYQHQILSRSKPPVVDVVILSDAHTADLAVMTRHTIDTCKQGAGEHPVNVVVVEQQHDIRYPGAITIHEPSPFAYNAFANKAAATGTAPWILVANNDLDFAPGWLDPLLDAKHPVVSPANPGDTRQAKVTRNETGTTNGRHFSGWCFMIARTLWDKIGGLDEDFRAWCADDAVIEQVTRAGVKPMLVPASKVKHLTSKTFGPNPPDELTWAMVAKFEEKYGVKKFENDKRYLAWKRQQQRQLKAVPA